MRPLLLFAALTAAAAVLAAAYDPIADPAAIVALGSGRLTILSPSLFRFELARNVSAGFDDRATLAVVNRLLPVPAFTVTPINATAVSVTTSELTITYVEGGGAPAEMCANAHPDTDAAAPVRSPNYPNGTGNTTTQAECCDLCGADPACTAWVWDEVQMCYPLAASGGTRPAASRVFGGGGLLPIGSSLTAAFTGPDGSAASWSLGQPTDAANLNGTYTALDCYSTPMQCAGEYYAAMKPGLLSAAGWAVHDDAGTARFVPAPDSPAGMPTWWSQDGMADAIDVYFQAHGGLDFRGALADWASVMGRAPMLPRSAFGVWWSRYWPYTQTSIVQEVLAGYANNSIPLNNLVLDMDWHNEPTDKTCGSWGNYDVNTTKFPDMVAFGEQVHADGVVLGSPLKLSFNVHPQTGVDHCDSRYPQFARAVGVDPATNATVPCDFGNKTFVDALYNIYFDAEPLHVIDILWADYGGCGGPAGASLLWNNRVMYDHQQYGRGVRGQAFARYGGTGNHRYPHGFSGDTFQHEVALHWQVKTTQTAANVMWGYWSHDIGGFHDGQGAPGDHDPTNSTGAELLLRWIQFGAVAPILRTHCDHCERRIWLFPFFEAMRDAMRLRNALGSYLYSAARGFYDGAVAPVHPLYYDWPRDAAVYAPAVVERQFMFGDAVLAAPVTVMAAGGTAGAPVPWSVYLPAGAWADWNGTHTYAGPATVDASYGPADVPLFVRPSFGPLPLKTMASVAGNFPDPLVWAMWPGAAAGASTLYEDDGDSDAYQGGEYVTINASFAGDPATATKLAVTIGAARLPGALPAGFPQARGHVLQVRGVGASGRTVGTVTVNGVPVPPASPGVVPGWYVSGAASHSLAQPAGSLVVAMGAHGSFVETIALVTFAA